MKLENVLVRGYKSISSLDKFELKDLNVLIGANGSGKSNFIGVFRLMAAIANGNLQAFVQKQGGPDTLLHGSRKRTQQIDIEVYFSKNRGRNLDWNNGYQISLTPTVDNRLIFNREETLAQSEEINKIKTTSLGVAHSEAKLIIDQGRISTHVLRAMQSWRQYHFHDTSDSATVKRPHNSNDNLWLKPAADNLAAYLIRLKKEFYDSYQRIVDTIKLAAPFFGDFVIREPLPEVIELEWFEKNNLDTPYKAHVLSDGTLRFICLTTLLLQPVKMLPDIVIIDEPELGLHPYAINLLAEMLKEVSKEKQVIISTQSVELLNTFEVQDVIVVDRENDATVLKRLDSNELKDWLNDYSLGELWKRNILGGRPTRQ